MAPDWGNRPIKINLWLGFVMSGGYMLYDDLGGKNEYGLAPSSHEVKV